MLNQNSIEQTNILTESATIDKVAPRVMTLVKRQFYVSVQSIIAMTRVSLT